MTDRVFCHKCGLGFTVREPAEDVERMRCAECDRPFWCVNGIGVCHAGVTPAGAEQFSPTRPQMHRARVMA